MKLRFDNDDMIMLLYLLYIVYSQNSLLVCCNCAIMIAIKEQN